MEAVLNGGPWTFDNNMLIVDRVQLGMQIENIPLFHADFWVQIHNLPAGFMQEKVGIKLANYIGTFMEYDKNNNTSFWRQYMRVRVKVDVRQPLKKGQRVRDKEGAWCMVNFKYEKLGVFCFVCGVMGHAENKCEVRFAMENDDGRREWSGELRADQRRGGGRQTSRWLREDGESGNIATGDGERRRERSTVEIHSTISTSADRPSSAHVLPRHQHAGVNINGALIPTNCHAANSNAAFNNSLETDGNNCSALITATHSRQVTRQELISIDACQNQQSLEFHSPLKPVTELPPLFGNQYQIIATHISYPFPITSLTPHYYPIIHQFLPPNQKLPSLPNKKPEKH
jgi:14-3-3 protein epsilon